MCAEVTPEQSLLNFEAYQRWDVAALKKHLKARGISGVGSKAMLVARAFSAQEQNLPILKDKKELDEIREQEYQSRLVTDDEGRMPDPFYDLNSGWKTGKEGVALWPPTVIQKHEVVTNKVSFTQRLLND